MRIEEGAQHMQELGSVGHRVVDGDAEERPAGSGAARADQVQTPQRTAAIQWRHEHAGGRLAHGIGDVTVDRVVRLAAAGVR